MKFVTSIQKITGTPLSSVEFRGCRTKVETCCKHATSLFSNTCIIPIYYHNMAHKTVSN